MSCSYTVGGETCVSSCITGCSTKDGQRRCGGGTTTVFVGVGIGSYGCYTTVDISLPLYTSYGKVGGHSTHQSYGSTSGNGVRGLLYGNSRHTYLKKEPFISPKINLKNS